MRVRLPELWIVLFIVFEAVCLSQLLKAMGPGYLFALLLAMPGAILLLGIVLRRRVYEPDVLLGGTFVLLAFMAGLTFFFP